MSTPVPIPVELAQEAGKTLQALRESQGRHREDFVTELKSSGHQLLALEQGRIEVFYGQAYYRSLFLRYGQKLGLSSDAALALITPPPKETVEPSEGLNAELPFEGPAEPMAEQPSPEPATSSLSADPAEVAEPRPARGLVVSRVSNVLQVPRLRLVAGLALVGLAVIGVTRWADVGSSTSPSQPSAAQTLEAQAETQASAEASAAPDAAGTNNTTNAISASAATSGTSTAAVASVPVTAAQPASTSAPASVPTLSATSPTQAAPTPSSQPIKAQPDATVSGKAVVLKAKTNSYVWVRQIDNSVRQQNLQAGETFEIAEMPVFLVVNNPAQIEAFIGGKPVRLVRNDPDRVQGRYTRTMLEQAQKIGRIPVAEQGGTGPTGATGGQTGGN